MLKSCLGSLAVFLPILLAYYLSLDAPLPQRAIMAFLAATGTWLGLMTLWSIRVAFRDARAVRSAHAGAPLRDGEWTALFGTIVADEGALRSPFTDEECCVYAYKVGSAGLYPGHLQRVDLEGYGMAACHVESDRGSIALLGFPDLDAFPAQFPDSPEVRQRGQVYVDTTEFERTDTGMRDTFSLREQLYGSAEPTIRRDWKEGSQRVDLAQESIVERRVQQGTRVCVFGRYSAAKRALVGSYGNGDMIQIKKPDPVTASPFRTWAWRLVLGVALIALCNAALWGAVRWTQASTGRAHESELQQALVQAVKAGQVERVRQLATPERLELWQDEYGELLFQATDPAIVRLLIEGGAPLDARDGSEQTALHQAISRHNLETAAALVAAGADVNTERASDGETPLWTALSGWDPAFVTLLLEAGAKDDRVTESDGEALPADGGAALQLCQRYVDAIHAEDGELIRGLSTAVHSDEWSLFAPELLERVPVRFDSFRGFEMERRVTLRVVGPGPSGSEQVMTFQLVTVNGEWRVHREAGDLLTSSAAP
jgi:hypothetical protein